VVNVNQAASWDGDEGTHWAEHADRYDAGMRDYAVRLGEAACVATHESVLDVGCGNGNSTRNAARAASSGRAVGLDLSSPMLARARSVAAAEGLTNVEFVQGDAQVFEFEPAAFDIAISRFGVMFFDDPTAAFSNIARALKPGGRLAMIVWRTLAENEWFSAMREALAVGRELPTPGAGSIGPFGLSEAPFVQQVLGAAGYSDVALEPVDAPFYTGTDADDAYGFVSELGFTRFMVQDLDDRRRAEALAALRAAMVAHDHDRGVEFGSATWLITARVP
jgi:SAM-dependent methyltransferase